MYGYLIKFCDYNICFCVDEPNYDGVVIEKYNWSNIPYSNGTEDIPTDAPEAKGKQVVLFHYYNTTLICMIFSLEDLLQVVFICLI